MADQKYRVVERIEAGGMAEVFIGEAVSVEGFRKPVAIKRVLPHLTQNKDFVNMFLDEARLGARLNHANVVTVFDVGSTDNSYFIVMEYIDGANLKSLAENVHGKRRAFPGKEAIFITMEAARGLSYAHDLLDDHGQPLRIVHRDVSPPNIMLSRRGEVKVMDFGLAKATTQLESTDPGVVKGKFGYLSPEAANGADVDARADIFALGVVLWELLEGRRLFRGETDYQTVKLVAEANIPPLTLERHEGLHHDIERVILKALEKRPENRFQTCREFGDALADFLFDHRLKVTSYDLANLVRTYIPKRVPKNLAAENSQIATLIQEELTGFVSIGQEAERELADGSSPLDLQIAPGSEPLMTGELSLGSLWEAQPTTTQTALGGIADHLDSGAPAALPHPTEVTHADAESPTDHSPPPERHAGPKPVVVAALTTLTLVAIALLALLGWHTFK